MNPVNPWDDIVPFNDFSTTPEISSDFIPSWAGGFVREVSACAQTPEGFGVMMAFAAIAASVQKRFCVCPYDDSYKEPVNIWTVGALPPGSRKSFVIGEMTRPLIDWEKEKDESMKSAIHENVTERNVIKKRIDKLENAAAGESDEIQRRTIIQEVTSVVSLI